MMRIWLLLAIAFILNACSNPAPVVENDRSTTYLPITQPRISSKKSLVYRPPAYSGVFEKPDELEPAVEFWRKTYTEWHLSEVAIHDDRYLDVIYEVMVLPGDVDDSLTSEQKEMINQRRDYWKVQLAVLESKLRYNARLNDNDRKIISKLENYGRPLYKVINGASERVRSQRGIRERFKHGLEISRRYDRQFRQIFRDAGLPEDLACLPHVESSFQMSAKSSAGAVGLWQFTKAAAQTFIPNGNRVDLRNDPFASTIGAARYLSYAYSRLADWPTAITSYNHGIGGMKRAQNEFGRDFVRIVENYNGPAFGFASRNFYAQFLAAREIANNPKQYFPEGAPYEFPLEPDYNLATNRNPATGQNLAIGRNLATGQNLAIGRNLATNHNPATSQNLAVDYNLTTNHNPAAGHNLAAE